MHESLYLDTVESEESAKEVKLAIESMGSINKQLDRLEISNLPANLKNGLLDSLFISAETLGLDYIPIETDIALEAEKGLLEKAYDTFLRIINKAISAIKRVTINILNKFANNKNKMSDMLLKLKNISTNNALDIPESIHSEITERFGILTAVNNNVFDSKIFDIINYHIDRINDTQYLHDYAKHAEEFLKYSSSIYSDDKVNDYRAKLQPIKDNDIYFTNKETVFNVHTQIGGKIGVFSTKVSMNPKGFAKAFTYVTRIDGKTMRFVIVKNSKTDTSPWMAKIKKKLHMAVVTNDMYAELDLHSNSSDKFKISKDINIKTLINNYDKVVVMSSNFSKLSKDFYVLMDSVNNSIKTTKRSEMPKDWLGFYSSISPRFSMDLLVGTHKLIYNVNWLVYNLLNDKKEK